MAWGNGFKHSVCPLIKANLVGEHAEKRETKDSELTSRPCHCTLHKVTVPDFMNDKTPLVMAANGSQLVHLHCVGVGLRQDVLLKVCRMTPAPLLHCSFAAQSGHPQLAVARFCVPQLRKNTGNLQFAGFRSNGPLLGCLGQKLPSPK